MKQKIQIAIVSVLFIFSACENKEPNKHLIRLQLTGFVFSGNGSRLDFPVFAEHISLEAIEETVQTGEEIHEKLSKLYSFKHFSLFELANWDGLISSEIEIQRGEPVFKNLVPMVLKNDFEVEVFFSSIKDDIGELSFRIDRKGSINGGTKYQTVKLKSGQSVSIASLYSEKGNSGLLYVLSIESLGFNGNPSEQSVRDFFENSKLNKGSKTSEEWTQLIHEGVEAISYSIRKNDPSLKSKGTPKTVVGEFRKGYGYNILPKPLSPIKPVYPKKAIEQGIEGEHLLRVLVGKDGHPKQILHMKGKAIFQSAAWKAVNNVKFTPAEKDGEPQEAWVVIPISFKFDKSEISLKSRNAPPPPSGAPKVKFVPYDKPPRPLSPIRPKYPKRAKDAGIEGTIVIQVLVGADGSVKHTQVLKGIPNTGLDEAATEAVQDIMFEPAEKDGVPQEVWISIPINFKLN